MTLNEKYQAVQNNEQLTELFIQELQNRRIVYSKKGCKINGKKVGINKWHNALKYAAAYVYDNPQQITQQTLF